MIDVLQREFVYLWFYFSVQFAQIFRYWAIGIVVGSIVSVFLKDKIKGWMSSFDGDKLGIIGIIPAAVLGILSPLCMYGTIPIVASFARSGMRQDWIASFMMSSVLLNPQLFVFSFALGNDLAILRLLISLLSGILAGILVRLFFKNKSFYKMEQFEARKSRDTDPNIGLRVLKNIYRNVKITLPYLLIGVLLTALYQRYVPSQWITMLFREDRGFGTLMAAAIGVPLYTCGGGTIPIIDAWLAAGMSSGSAIAFMIAGPATKISNLGALKIVLTNRHFAIYLAFAIIYASLSGFILNLI